MAAAVLAESPVASATPEVRARVTLIDAMRGAALFGVLLVNMLWFAGQPHAVSEAQFAALPTARLDAQVTNFIDLFVTAKAIGIFSFLFGIGFALQLPKLGRRYPRRLFALLALGLVHWIAVWSGEILHVYAVAGFALLLVHRMRSALLVAFGLILAIFARPIVGRLYLLIDPGLGMNAGLGELLDSAHEAQRFAVMSQGSFLDVVSMQLQQDIRWQLLTGATLAAIVHALGRFMLGVAVARGGYLYEPGKYRRAFVWLVLIALPVGFVLEHQWVFTVWLSEHSIVTKPIPLEIVGHAINSMGVLLMTAGYVATFALAWLWGPVHRMLLWLAPAGRMALTNYLMHTVVNYLLFCGFGLGLIGRVGVAACLALSLVVFVAQILVSRWWLAKFDFGPFEWLWRWSTYGVRPPMRGRAAA